MANIVHEQSKLLVWKFVDQPNWPKEIKLAKKLLCMYSLDFLLTIELPKKLFSLAFFLTSTGKQVIERAEKLQKLEF